MSAIQILEVLLGLVVLYIFLSIIITAFNEFFAWITRKKIRYLNEGIKAIVQDRIIPFYNHPLIKTLDPDASTRNTLSITDIPDTIFADTAISLATEDKIDSNEILSALKEKSDSFSKQILIHFKQAGGDLQNARQNIIHWYNESWRTYSIRYKQWTMLISFITALIIAFCLNLDSIMFIRFLWTNEAMNNLQKTCSEAVAGDSGLWNQDDTALTKYFRTVETAAFEIRQRFFPFGWKGPCYLNGEDLNQQKTAFFLQDLRCLPVFCAQWALKILGIAFTALAVSLGAEYWFKVLEKYLRIKT